MGKSKRRNWKRRNPTPKRTRITVTEAIERKVSKFGAELQATIDAAEAEGKYGVMVILEDETSFICDLVPKGKVFRAGSMEAVEKMRARMEAGEYVEAAKPVSEDIERPIA